MGRKLRSLFPSITPRPGSGDAPQPLPGRAIVGGTADSAVQQEAPIAGSAVEHGRPLMHDEVARLAYLRWLEVGGSSVDNWLWAEAELKLREGSGAEGGD
ncbi:MAG: hypothetical protein QM783_11850 [Phycisphaerales bacterium]